MKKNILALAFIIAFNTLNAQCIGDMSAGDWANFVIRSDGRIYGWGQRNLGPFVGCSFPLNIGNDTDWQKISAGGEFFVAQKTNGTLWQCSIHALADYHFSTYLNQIGTDTDWQTFSVSSKHTSAIKTNGTLWSWGDNFYFQLGDGTNSTRNTPVQIGTDTNWQKIFTGPNHCLAIKTDGSLYAWGQGDYGQIGNSYLLDRTTAILVGTDSDWVTAAAGSDRSYAIKTNGTLWGWGRNTSWQLGTGTNYDYNIPVQIGTDTHWKEVLSYGNIYGSTYEVGYTLALKTDGTMWAWGQNNNAGTLLPTSSGNLHTPTQVGTANDWQKIEIGVKHILAMKTDGTVWVWGENWAAQFGLSTGGSQTFTPQLVNCAAWLSNDDFTEENRHLYIHPNPAKEAITIEGLQFESDYKIYNSLGQTIQSGTVSPDAKINISGFSKGLYYINIGNRTLKLTKD